MLLDSKGQPIKSGQSFRKASPPKLGEQFGDWHQQLPGNMFLPGGGGLIQLNLDRLTLMDYRLMRDHYQVNSSLTALTFMLHQIDWHIECSTPKIATVVEEILRPVWSRLVRALSQAFWSGFSPNILQWENDSVAGRVVLAKVKDLDPMTCEVNWKRVDGYKSPTGITQKINIYDGIKQLGAAYPIPVDNSLWYPLLMENGNLYGRKILRAAYTSYFFSILMHMFANRYFERFGEPTPMGRAPFEEMVQVGSELKSGKDMMLDTLSALRSRGVVALPNDRDSEGNLEYTVEYLESQMRGADFERYLLRLDEEISVAIFTPLLMMRTADVGSGNLGVGHMQMYLWMLNAIANDWAEYINDYVISRLVDYNFSDKAPRAQIVFRKLGKENAETIRAMLAGLISNGTVKPDIRELGQMAGLTLVEIEQVTAPDDPAADPAADDQPEDKRVARVRDDKGKTKGVGTSVTARVAAQVSKMYRVGTFGPDLELDFGYRRQVQEITGASATEITTAYSFLEDWAREVATIPDLTEEDFMKMLGSAINEKLAELVR